MSALRTAIIGYGLAGRVFHTPLVSSNDAFELAAVVTGNPERADAVRSKYPGVRIVGTVDDLLLDASAFDLVIVAAPTPDHASLVERTLRAGLATVVDKPLAVHLADAERLVALSAELGVPLTVFQNRRWDGDFMTVKKLIDEGQLGDVWRFESRFEWISSRPRPVWKSDTRVEDGGGVAYDLGAHLIDQAVQLFGPVTEVYGELDRRRAGAANDDDSFIAITHESGVRSHLAMSSLVAQRGFRFRVLGSQSAYTKWGLDPQEGQLSDGLTPLDDGFGIEPESAWGRIGRDGETTALPTVPGAYGEFYSRLAKALTGRGPFPVDPLDALTGIRTIERLHHDRG